MQHYTKKQKIIAFLINIRIPQFLFLTASIITGLIVAWITTPFNITIELVITLTILITALWFGWTASVLLNDAYDIDIDCISNPHRPLSRGIFTPLEFINYGYIAYSIATFLALFLTTQKATIFFLLFLILNHIYNAPPFRLKRFPLIATLTAACAFQSLVFAGFFLALQHSMLTTYPFSLIETLIVLTTLTLIIPIKDFKDIRGDKHGHISTLPIILGPTFSRIVILSGIIIGSTLPFLFLQIQNFSTLSLALFSSTIAGIILFASHPRYHRITPKNLLPFMLIPGIIYATGLLFLILKLL